MGTQGNNQYMTIILLVAIIFVSFSRHALAARPLDQGAEQWLVKNLTRQSLQRAPVPPTVGTPCTYIPGRGKGCLGEISGRG
ncbi:hypothetical protein NC651_025627 [Populus alba x Populus x berolinensis]|nr:hypothetical protein NC651_025627 [Populus alba x Populus x berolinensis]